MKFYLKMLKSLKVHCKSEMANASMTIQTQDYADCLYHLERAHKLEQLNPMEHTAVHWSMMCLGFRTKNMREIIGQLPRLLFSSVTSFVGKIPSGNTGEAHVNVLKPIPISEESRNIINSNTL